MLSSGFHSRSLLLVTAHGKGNIQGRAKEAQLLMQGTKVFVASLDGPGERTMAQLDGVSKKVVCWLV